MKKAVNATAATKRIDRSREPAKKKVDGNFAVNSTVQVKVNAETVEGIVKFCGETDFSPGIWVGIELTEPKGKNDGTVNGKSYFTCKSPHGIFVRPTNVTVLDSLKGSQEDSSPKKDRPSKDSKEDGSVGSSPKPKKDRNSKADTQRKDRKSKSSTPANRTTSLASSGAIRLPTDSLTEGDSGIWQDFVKAVQDKDGQRIASLLADTNQARVLAMQIQKAAPGAAGGQTHLKDLEAEIRHFSEVPELADEIHRVSSQVKDSLRLNFPVLILSEPAHMRFSLLAVRHAVTQTAVEDGKADRGIVQVALHGQSTAEDLLGSAQIGDNRAMTFVPGCLVKAVRDGRSLVLEGLNFAPKDAVEIVEGILVQVFQSKAASGTPRCIKIPGAVAASQAISLKLENSPDQWMDALGHLCFKCNDEFRLVVMNSQQTPLTSLSLLSHFVGICFAPPAFCNNVGKVTLATTSAQDETREVEAGKLEGLVQLDTHRNVWAMCDSCVASALPGLIVGDPGSGKASAWGMWAIRRQPEDASDNDQRFLAIRLNEATSNDDLFGAIVPCAAKPGEAPFKWRDGPVSTAIKNGWPVLLCGMHLPSAAALYCLAPLLRSPRATEILINNKSEKVHPGFCLFGTISTAAKQFLSASLLSSFAEIDFGGLISCDELQILGEKMLEPTKMKKPDIRSVVDNIIEATLRDNFRLGPIARTFQRTRDILISVGIGTLGSDVVAKVTECIKFFEVLDDQADLDNIDDFKKMISSLLSNDKGAFPGGREDILLLLRFLYASNTSAIMEGPPGCGKTYTAEQLAKSISKESAPPLLLAMSSSMDAEELFGSFRPQANCCFQYIPGPLEVALKEGRILIVDEINLGTPSVLQKISEALTSPVVVTNPVNGEVIRGHPDFWLVGTQNPTSLSGRNELPEALRTRSVVLSIPGYSAEEQKKIVMDSKHFPKNVSSATKQVAVDELYKESNRLQKESNTLFDIRGYVKICRRVAGTPWRQAQKGHTRQRTTLLGLENTQDDIKLLVRLHVSAYVRLKGDCVSEIEFVPSSQGKAVWRFALGLPGDAGKNKPKVQVELPASAESENLVTVVEKLSATQKGLLCQIAVALSFEEPVLLIGASSVKAYLAKLMARMLYFDNFSSSTCLNTPLLSKHTDLEALLGGVEPHSSASYAKYCANYAQHLFDVYNIQTNGDSREEVLKQLKQLQEKAKEEDQALVEELYKVLSEASSGKQIFPVCERGIAPSIRYGGLCLLMHVGSINVSVLEGLNSLFEVEANDFTNPLMPSKEKVKIHPQFYMIATAHSLDSLSLAVRSRFTCLIVPDPSPAERTQGCMAQLLDAAGLKDASGVRDDLQGTVSDVCAKLPNIHKAVCMGSLAGLVVHPEGQEVASTEDAKERTALVAQMVTDTSGENKSCDSWDKLTLTQGYDPANLWKNQVSRNAASSLILWHLVAASKCRSKGLSHQVPLFVGPPGVGKTYVCAKACEFLKCKFVRVQCSINTQIEDLFGQFVSNKENADDGRPAFTFSEGIVARAAQEGPVVILFDELNLLGAEALSELESLLRLEGYFRVRDVTIDLKKCIFCATMNPESVEDGRAALPERMMKLLCTVNIDIDGNDMKSLLLKDWEPKAVNVDTIFAVRPVLGLGLRDLLRMKRLLLLQDNLHAVVLAFRLALPGIGKQREEAHKQLQEVFEMRNEAQLSEEFAHDFPPITSDELVLAACLTKTPSLDTYPGFIMIQGPPCCGKRNLAIQAAKILRREIIEVFITSETRESDLFGEIVPIFNGSTTEFKFVDGPVVRAVTEGKWLLMSCIDRIRPEVLERLNSLGETPPSLSLVDKGQLKVDANFRLFCTAITTETIKPKLSGPFCDRCVIFHLGSGLKEWCAAADNMFRNTQILEEFEAQDEVGTCVDEVYLEQKEQVNKFGATLPATFMRSADAANAWPTLRGLSRTSSAYFQMNTAGLLPAKGMLLRMSYGSFIPRGKNRIEEDAKKEAGEDSKEKQTDKKVKKEDKSKDDSKEKAGDKTKGDKEKDNEKEKTKEKPKSKPAPKPTPSGKKDEAPKSKPKPKVAPTTKDDEQKKKEAEEAWYKQVEEFDLQPKNQGMMLKQFRLFLNEHCGEKGEKLQTLCDNFNVENADAIKNKTKFPMGPNLYAVDTLVARPLTANKKCAVAQLFNKTGLAVDFFVSHAWAHPFVDTVACLSEFCQFHHPKLPQEMVKGRSYDQFAFWVCMFANNQYELQRVLGKTIEESSFVRMLSSNPSGLVMVLDERCLPLTRAWCICELNFARKLNLDVDLWTRSSITQTEKSLEEVDVSKAQASVEADKEMIFDSVKDFDDPRYGTGVPGLNRYLKEESWDMLLRFYNMTGNREGAKLARKKGANSNSSTGITTSQMVPMEIMRLSERQHQRAHLVRCLCSQLLSLDGWHCSMQPLRVIIDNCFQGVGLQQARATQVLDITFSILSCLATLHVPFEVVLAGNRKYSPSRTVKRLDQRLPDVWADIAHAAFGPGGGDTGKPDDASNVTRLIHFGMHGKSLSPEVRTSLYKNGIGKLGLCKFTNEPYESTPPHFHVVDLSKDAGNDEGSTSVLQWMKDLLLEEGVEKKPVQADITSTVLSSGDPFFRQLHNKKALDDILKSASVLSIDNTDQDTELVCDGIVENAAPESAILQQVYQVTKACQEATLVHSPGDQSAIQELWDNLQKDFSTHISVTSKSMLKTVQSSGLKGAGQGRKLSVRKLIKWFATNGTTIDIWEPRKIPSRAQSSKVEGSIILVLDVSNEGGQQGKGAEFSALVTSAVFGIESAGASIAVIRWDRNGVQLVKPSTFPTKESKPSTAWDMASKSCLLRALADAQEPARGKTSEAQLSHALLAAGTMLVEGNYPHPRRVLLAASSFALADHAGLIGAWQYCSNVAKALCTTVSMCSSGGALPRCAVIGENFNPATVASAVTAALAGDESFRETRSDLQLEVVKEGEQVSLMGFAGKVGTYINASMEYEAEVNLQQIKTTIRNLLKESGQAGDDSDNDDDTEKKTSKQRWQKAKFKMFCYNALRGAFNKKDTKTAGKPGNYSFTAFLPELSHSGCVLSNSNATLSGAHSSSGNPANYARGPFFPKSGIHKFSIRVDRALDHGGSNDCYIGVVSERSGQNLGGMDKYNLAGAWLWLLEYSNRSIFYADGEEVHEASRPFPSANDVITVEVNMDLTSVAFYLNGTKVYSYVGITETDLQPCAMAFYSRTQITITENPKDQQKVEEVGDGEKGRFMVIGGKESIQGQFNCTGERNGKPKYSIIEGPGLQNAAFVNWEKGDSSNGEAFWGLTGNDESSGKWAYVCRNDTATLPLVGWESRDYTGNLGIPYFTKELFYTVIADSNVSELGFQLTGLPPNPGHVGAVAPSGWADQAGLKPGDEIKFANGRAWKDIGEGDITQLLKVRPLDLKVAKAAEETKPQPKPETSYSLDTGNQPGPGNSGYRCGVFFDVTNKHLQSNIKIHAMAGGGQGGDRNAVLYATLDGATDGKEADETQWKQIWTGTLNHNKSTEMDLKSPIILEVGSSRGFLLYSDTYSLYHSNSRDVMEDDNIMIRSGTRSTEHRGEMSPFDPDGHSPGEKAMHAGTIRYVLTDEKPQPAADIKATNKVRVRVRGSLLPEANGFYTRDPDANPDPELRCMTSGGQPFGHCYRKLGTSRTLFPDKDGAWCLGENYEYNDISGGSSPNVYEDYRKALPWEATFEESELRVQLFEARIKVSGSELPEANGIYMRQPDVIPESNYRKNGQPFGSCYRKMGTSRTLFNDSEGSWCLGTNFEYDDTSGGSTGNAYENTAEFPWEAALEYNKELKFTPLEELEELDPDDPLPVMAFLFFSILPNLQSRSRVVRKDLLAMTFERWCDPQVQRRAKPLKIESIAIDPDEPLAVTFFLCFNHMKQQPERVNKELLAETFRKWHSLTAGPKNDDGAPVKLGDDGRRYYCGRNVGRDALPGSDGFCGPDNGPQCPSCRRYQEKEAPLDAESVAGSNAEAEKIPQEQDEFRKLLGEISADAFEAYDAPKALITVSGSHLPEANGLYMREPDVVIDRRFEKEGASFGHGYRKIGTNRTLFPDSEGSWCLGSDYTYNDTSGGSTGNQYDDMAEFPWDASWKDWPNIAIVEATSVTLIETVREKREALNIQILQEEEDKAKIEKELSILTDRLGKVEGLYAD